MPTQHVKSVKNICIEKEREREIFKMKIRFQRSTLVRRKKRKDSNNEDKWEKKNHIGYLCNL